MNDNIRLSEKDAWGFPANWQFYMELSMVASPSADPLPIERAPVDYVMAGDTIAQCSAQHVNGDLGWPIICQQEYTHINPSVDGAAYPSNCPNQITNPPPVHSSLAFGWVGTLDMNPCDNESGRTPTMYHAASFDGQTWI